MPYLQKGFQTAGKTLSFAAFLLEMYRLGDAMLQDFDQYTDTSFALGQVERAIEDLVEYLGDEADKMEKEQYNDMMDHLAKLEMAQTKLVAAQTRKWIPENVMKASASLAGGWTGGLAGGAVGMWASSQTGAFAGKIFGPAGSVVGGCFGAVAGAFTGGYLGSTYGSEACLFVANLGIEALRRRE